jgi:hypothetical protein
MSSIRVKIDLPYLLLLPPGNYVGSGAEGSILIEEAVAPGAAAAHTAASLVFGVAEGADHEQQRHAQADRLLRRVNHMLRWYRAITGYATVTELTRAQASPFQFTNIENNQPWGDLTPLEYEAVGLTLPAAGDADAIGSSVRNGFASGTEPDVATLNLLDAEYALSVGRFREAVLLCWGAIDSTFVRKFRRLVDEQLGEEWAEGRDFLKGIDFGLRHKMTTGLRLLIGRSLFHEPGGFWQELSSSYSLRNRIIHDGQIAHEDEAKTAIKVARKIVGIVASINRPEAPPGR